MANKERTWFVDKLGKIGIVEKATNAVTRDGHTNDWTSITESKSFRIYAISRDDDISIDEPANSFLQIPAQFHEVIVYKAIANGYKEPRNINPQIAQYFDGEYLAGVKEAKKFSKSNYITTGFIKQQDY